MEASICCDERSNFKPYLVIGQLIKRDSEFHWVYVESIMPEGNCADWAEKFWDAASDQFDRVG